MISGAETQIGGMHCAQLFGAVGGRAQHRDGGGRIYNYSLAQHWARDWRALALTQEEELLCAQTREYLDLADTNFNLKGSIGGFATDTHAYYVPYDNGACSWRPFEPRARLRGARLALRLFHFGLRNRTHTTQKYNILPQSTTSDFGRRA